MDIISAVQLYITMRYLARALLCLHAVANLVVAASDHADGLSPYGDAFAPDVTLDPGWNISAPSFEGDAPPDFAGEDAANANDTNVNATVLDTGALTRRSAGDFFLRVMPLGASITEGVASSDGNGYRKWLRQQLRWKGWRVNMVGSKMNGNMADKVRGTTKEGHVVY